MGQNSHSSQSRLPPEGNNTFISLWILLVAILIEGGERRKLKVDLQDCAVVSRYILEAPRDPLVRNYSGGGLMADLCVSVLLCCD